jgi:hypothetical protein
MADLRAKKCVTVRSSWVRAFIEMCDLNLAVQYYDSHHPHHPRRPHPRPDVCCYYPGTVGLFNLAVSWRSPGRFVHRFLYRKRPYWIIRPPCPAVDCGVSVGCCPGVSLPSTIHATVAGCACINGTYALTWNGTQWASGVIGAGACGGQQSLNLFLTCSQGGNCSSFQLRFQCNSSSFATVHTPQPGCTCSPLNLVFAFTQSAGETGVPCCPNQALTVTITA